MNISNITNIITVVINRKFVHIFLNRNFSRISITTYFRYILKIKLTLTVAINRLKLIVLSTPNKQITIIINVI